MKQSLGFVALASLAYLMLCGFSFHPSQIPFSAELNRHKIEISREVGLNQRPADPTSFSATLSHLILSADLFSRSA